MSLLNLLEWTVLISAALFAIDASDCHCETGLRLHWQWQAGALAVTTAWLNLVLNIR